MPRTRPWPGAHSIPAPSTARRSPRRSREPGAECARLVAGRRGHLQPGRAATTPYSPCALPEESLGDLLQPLIARLTRPAQNPLDVRAQPRLPPLISRCFLGRKRLTDPGPLQERPGRRSIVVRVIPRRQAEGGFGAVVVRVLADKGSGNPVFRPRAPAGTGPLAAGPARGA